MVVLVPVNQKIFKLAGKMRRRVLKHSDARVKLTNEILAGIRILKFSAWETPFKQQVCAHKPSFITSCIKLQDTFHYSFITSCIKLCQGIRRPLCKPLLDPITTTAQGE